MPALNEPNATEAEPDTESDVDDAAFDAETRRPMPYERSWVRAKKREAKKANEAAVQRIIKESTVVDEQTITSSDPRARCALVAHIALRLTLPSQAVFRFWTKGLERPRALSDTIPRGL